MTKIKKQFFFEQIVLSNIRWNLFMPGILNYIK